MAFVSRGLFICKFAHISKNCQNDYFTVENGLLSANSRFAVQKWWKVSTANNKRNLCTLYFNNNQINLIHRAIFGKKINLKVFYCNNWALSISVANLLIKMFDSRNVVNEITHTKACPTLFQSFAFDKSFACIVLKIHKKREDRIPWMECRAPVLSKKQKKKNTSAKMC